MQSLIIKQTDKLPEPWFSDLQRSVFDDLQAPGFAFNPVVSSEAMGRAGLTTSGTVTHAPIARFVAYDGDELVGWSFGWMERGDTFYMANSGVISSHRRRGVYSKLMTHVVEYARSHRAVEVHSQHCVVNNPVIIAKLRFGFQISGLSLNAQMGTLVELKHHIYDARSKVFRDRAIPFAVSPNVSG